MQLLLGKAAMGLQGFRVDSPGFCALGQTLGITALSLHPPQLWQHQKHPQ